MATFHKRLTKLGKPPLLLSFFVAIREYRYAYIASLMDCLSYAAAWWVSPDDPEDVLPQVHRLDLFEPDDPRSPYYHPQQAKK